MMLGEVVTILCGAAFTVAFCAASGSLLFDLLGVRLYRIERPLLAFIAGAACVSTLVFLLCATHTARKGVFLAAGAVVMAAAWRSGRQRAPQASLPPAPRVWRLFFLAVFAAYLIVYFMHALAPEVSADGVAYHLGNVERFNRNHGFVWSHHNMYSYLPKGLEMLFLVAYSIGRHSAAAIVHCTFQAALAWLLMCFGRRTGHPRAGIFAALIVYTSPVVGLDGSIAYNDVCLAAVLVAIVYCLNVIDDNNENKLLIVVGLLCGFAFAIKYTAALILPYAVFQATTPRKRTYHAPLTVLAGSALTALPWIVRNWLWIGNPLAPFFNRWFPNPWYHTGMEEIYTRMLRDYQGLESAWRLPIELTVRGGAGVQGILGPAFLLAPLALLACRYPLGRKLLLAAACLLPAAFLNVGTRFLIPAAPFVALAIGLALSNTRGALFAVALFQTVVAWPSVLPFFCHPYAWRLPREIPFAAALRQVPAAAYLAQHVDIFPLLQTIENEVPPDGRIYSFNGVPEAYLRREVLVSYESAEANLLNDVLLAAVHGYKPVQQLTFRFPEQGLAAVRVVATVPSPAFWSMAELRIYHAGAELPRAPDWRLSAHPNGWEVPLAFDNSPVTRWQSWEATRPGQYIEARFAGPQIIDSVRVQRAPEGHSVLRLEGVGQGSAGAWRTLSAAPEVVEAEPPRGMRLAATRELKARGVRYILSNQTDAIFPDLTKYAKYWGITAVGEAGGTFFFRID